MSKAFSYIRFSSIKQELGDSLRRQLSLAEDYAARHKLTLDTSSYRDLGLSAFKGKNAVEGALSAFIEAIDTGLVPKGSMLLVESLDRLSREYVDVALELFLNITRKGVTIVTLKDGQVYSKDSIRENWTKLIIALAEMARSHEESATKSLRIKQSWAKKRAAGEILTKICPAWLHWVDDGWKIKEDKANVVRRIYQLALDGNGAPTIARILNEDKVPRMAWATEWTFGPISAILKNDAVYGTLVPKKVEADPTPNYYPVIVERAVFDEVRARVKGRKWVGGKNSENVRNLFAGMSYCSKCGGRMRSVGSSAEHTYLRCLSAYSGSGCNEGRFPYLAAEQTILSKFHAQNRELIAKAASLKVDPGLTVEAELDVEKKRMDTLIKLAEATGDVSAVANRIGEVQKKIDALHKKKREVVEVPPDVKGIREIAGWYKQLEEVEGDEALKLRLQLQASIRRFLKKVEYDPSALNLTLTYASGKVRVMSVKDFMHIKGFRPGNRNGRNPDA
jgi:DNA invertase Pin-like site-specific DNA recombinase